ncbi:MAG: TIR domain-containing protein [Bacteroidales bacterium]
MERFQYYAFISYSRKDKKWAEWLHKKLENYKLPSIIRKESNGNLPKQIRPIFRDKTDIGPGDLEVNIKNELEDSRFLIVICSPAAADSAWVNKEIRHFKSFGRGERIIPFIIEGTPDPKNEHEKQCYPAELSTNTLGVSVKELSKEAACVKVIAAILGLKFDQLWQRHKRSEKRKIIIRSTALSLISFLLLSLSLWYWDYNRVKIKYFADYTERWGVPEGICKLTREEASHRYISYLFEYRRRKLQKVKIVGNKNQLRVEGHAEKAKREPETHFEYRADGKLLIKKCFNLVGFETVRYTFSEDLRTINIVSADERTPQSVNSGLTSTVNYNNQSEIIRFLNEYDSHGRLIKQEFAKDIWNTPAADACGIYGLNYEYFPNDQIKSVTYLDESGHKTVKSNSQQYSWESKKEFSYNTQGWLVKITSFDLDGEPSNNEWNYCSEEDIHDKWGNIIEIRFYDRRNQLTINHLNFAIERMVYDENGNIVEHSYHDKAGNPAECKFGYSKFTNEFDFSTDITTTTKYFDQSGQLKLNQQGFAISKTINSFPDSTIRVTIEYYNQKQKPCLLKDYGYFSVSSQYDKHGNLYMIVYRDTLGKFCVSNYGYVAYFAEYKDNLKTLETYLPLDSSKLIVEHLGYTKVTHQYDKWRNLIENRYFDRKMNPVNNAKGFHKECWAFDEKGNIRSVIYYNTNGELANNLDYNAAIYEAAYQYNDYGTPTITNNWYDKNRDPVTKNLPLKTTPLHYACSSGQPNMVMQLLAQGADKLSIGEDGLTPAQNAALFNKPECLALIYPKFNYNMPVTKVNNREDIDILNCQLILAGKETDIIQRYKAAIKLENQIILFSAKNPELVLSYYRCVALIADQLGDCQVAYSMFHKSYKMTVLRNENDQIRRGMACSCSWYALKAGKFNEAYDILKPYEQTIRSEKKTESLTMNFAHALFFNNKVEEAKEIYFANSGKQFPKSNHQNWNSILVNDFKILTWLGNGKKEMNEILKEMNLESFEVSTTRNDKPLHNQPIFGTWKCIENKTIIEWEIDRSGLSFYKFFDSHNNLLQKTVGVWRARQGENSIQFDEYYGAQIDQFAQAYIEITDNDHFTLTIIENGNKLYQFKKRKYTRIDSKKI